MDTKIVKGPNKLDLFLNFMLWGELINEELTFDLEFQLENHMKMTISRIVALEHESGSDAMFNIWANGIVVSDRFDHVKLIESSKVFFYSTHTRQGCISLDVLGADNIKYEDDNDLVFNPS